MKHEDTLGKEDYYEYDGGQKYMQVKESIGEVTEEEDFGKDLWIFRQ
jgi:hypothetical protein